MDVKYLVQGAQSAERMRRRLAKTGRSLSGQPLWSEWELETLKQLYSVVPYSEICKQLKGRSYWAVRTRAQMLGLTAKRHVWTGAEIVKLRRVYTSGTVAEVRAAFPDFSLEHIRATANNHGLFRPRKPFKTTGIPAVDQIRTRAFELGYSMVDVDALARTKRYFQTSSWHQGYVHHRAVAKAIKALDGVVSASWHEER